MAKENKDQAPGQDVNPDTNALETQVDVAENPQTQAPEETTAITESLKEQNDRFESNLERLEGVVSSLSKALNAMASAKGMAPVVQRQRKEFKLKIKSKKKK